MSKSKDLMKRQRILQAASKIFAQKGFTPAKISEIAREADVADGTIYLYFRDKTDLLNAVFEHNLETLLALTQKELRKAADPLSQLQIFVDMHLRFFGEHPDLCRIFQAEVQQNQFFDGSVAAGKNQKLGEYLHLLSEMILEGQSKGMIRQDLNAWLIQRVLFGALSDLALNAPKDATSPKHPAWRESADQAFQMFVGGLSSPHKAATQRLSAA